MIRIAIANKDRFLESIAIANKDRFLEPGLSLSGERTVTEPAQLLRFSTEHKLLGVAIKASNERTRSFLDFEKEEKKPVRSTKTRFYRLCACQTI